MHTYKHTLALHAETPDKPKYASWNLPLRVVAPFNELISVRADTGADVNAVDALHAHRHHRDRVRQLAHPMPLSTANGLTWCHEYIDLQIENGTEPGAKPLLTRFYLLWDLPFDWICGTNTMYDLHYRLVRSDRATRTCVPVLRDEDVFVHPRDLLDVDEDDEDENALKRAYPRREDARQLSESLENLLTSDKLKVGDRSSDFKDFVHSRLRNYAGAVSKSEYDVGLIDGAVFELRFKGGQPPQTPIRCAEYPHSVQHVAEIERQLSYLLAIGFIRHSKSAWRAPTFIVPKKCGAARIVFDYRRLNAVTERMAYGLPNMDRLRRRFAGMHWISTLDVKSGFWHVPVREDHCKYLAFAFNGTLYEWTRMPFGPTNSPPTFQMAMHAVLGDLPYVVCYVDDIAILSKTEAEHRQHLDTVLARLEAHNIKLRLDKCEFGVSHAEYLGFIVGADGIRVTPKYQNRIANMPMPRTKRQLMRWIGVVQFIARFLPDLAIKLRPFHAIVSSSDFTWTESHTQQFEAIKEQIERCLELAQPNLDEPFELYCDASAEGMGCVLCQRRDGRLVPIEFSSKGFSKTQSRWHCSEQEIYSVIWHCEKYRELLCWRRFKVFTDHKNLAALFNKAQDFKSGKLFRWAVRLQDFEFTAHYLKGKKNACADYLSRDALHAELTERSHPRTRPNTVNILRAYQEHLARSIVHTQQIVVPPVPCPTRLASHSDDVLHSHTPAFLIADSDARAARCRCCPTARAQQLDPPRVPPKPPHPPVGYSEYAFDGADHDTLRVAPPPQLSVPDHQYDTRYVERQRQAQTFFDGLRRRLEILPEDAPDAALLTNQRIVDEHPEAPCHNHALVDGTQVPFLDLYTHADTVTHAQIAQAQRQDAILWPIVNFLQTGNKFHLADIPKYWLRILHTGRLSLNADHALLYFWRDQQTLVVPSQCRRDALRWAHGDHAHNGRLRMLRRCEGRFWWPKMQNDIDAWIEHCDPCQRAGKAVTRPRGTYRPIKATRPFELVSIDLVGPLPTCSRTRHRYICTMIDKYSKYCLLIPLSNMLAVSVTRAFERWTTLFGAPARLLSDNGSQFLSATFRSYAQNNHIKQLFSSPYYPQGNGQIERLHKYIKERLTLIGVALGRVWHDSVDSVLDDERQILEWDDFLPIIQHSYNSVPHRVTNLSPNKIIFGSDLRLPLDDVKQDDDAIIPPADWQHAMELRRAIVHDEASAALARADRVRVARHAKTAKKAYALEVGDWVLYNTLGRDMPSMTAHWVGPYEVIEIENTRLRIRRVGDESDIKRTNLNMVKPYKRSTYMAVLSHLRDDDADRHVHRHVTWWTQNGGENIHCIRLQKDNRHQNHATRAARSHWF